MKTLRILDWPQQRFYSETHPFYRWKNQFKDRGIQVKCHHNHLDGNFSDADFVLIHSRYFDGGKNMNNGTRLDEDVLQKYFGQLKQNCGKLIWFDAGDSTGSCDFSIIRYVDIFLKKQLLKDRTYYTNPNSANDLRIWLNSDTQKPVYPFKPCPVDQLYKVKLGWNLGLNDYRYFGYKLSRLSNFLGYGLYPLKFSSAQCCRPLDLTFRGTIHEESNGSVKVSEQRNIVLKLLKRYKGNIASGHSIPKSKYWKELRESKLSVSPYGWGEICYRDFETFISGALLIKPSMHHLETYPDLYKANETYIPVSWDLGDLSQKLDYLISHFSDFTNIAHNGQEMFKNAVFDSDGFIDQVLRAIE